MELGFVWERVQSNGVYLCPVCGFPNCFDEYSFDDRGGVIATGHCPCCGFEPGMTDYPDENPGYETTLQLIFDYRRAWLWRGTLWPDDRKLLWRGDYRQEPPPPDWSPDEQLQNLFAIAPELADD